MINKLLFLLMHIVYFSIIFSIAMPFGKWLILDEDRMPVLIDAAKLGCYLGVYLGVSVWFLYFFIPRRR